MTPTCEGAARPFTTDIASQYITADTPEVTVSQEVNTSLSSTGNIPNPPFHTGSVTREWNNLADSPATMYDASRVDSPMPISHAFGEAPVHTYIHTYIHT